MKKFTWGHGIAIALGSFICFILYLILIFPIGKQNSELVTESYYEDELAYQKVIDAKANADNQKTKPFFARRSNAGISQRHKTSLRSGSSAASSWRIRPCTEV